MDADDNVYSPLLLLLLLLILPSDHHDDHDHAVVDDEVGGTAVLMKGQGRAGLVRIASRCLCPKYSLEYINYYERKVTVLVDRRNNVFVERYGIF